MPEVRHHPRQNRNVVQHHHVPVVHQAEADAFQPLLHVVVGYRGAAAVGLADCYLERESGNSEEEECCACSVSFGVRGGMLAVVGWTGSVYR